MWMYARGNASKKRTVVVVTRIRARARAYLLLSTCETTGSIANQIPTQHPRATSSHILSPTRSRVMKIPIVVTGSRKPHQDTILLSTALHVEEYGRAPLSAIMTSKIVWAAGKSSKRFVVFGPSSCSASVGGAPPWLDSTPPPPSILSGSSRPLYSMGRRSGDKALAGPGWYPPQI